MKKFGNSGTVMPRNARGSPAQYSWSVRPLRPTTAQAREVVRGLEAGGHDDDVDLALDAVGVDDAGRGHRRDRPRHELDVLLLERGVERAARRSAACRDTGTSASPPRAGRVGRRTCGRCSRGRTASRAALRLGAGPVELPPPEALLQHPLQPPAFPRAATAWRSAARSSSVKSRSPLGMTQPGSRWNT